MEMSAGEECRCRRLTISWDAVTPAQAAATALDRSGIDSVVKRRRTLEFLNGVSTVNHDELAGNVGS
jgi:hypothetical protein